MMRAMSHRGSRSRSVLDTPVGSTGVLRHRRFHRRSSCGPRRSPEWARDCQHLLHIPCARWTSRSAERMYPSFEDVTRQLEARSPNETSIPSSLMFELLGGACSCRRAHSDAPSPSPTSWADRDGSLSAARRLLPSRRMPSGADLRRPIHGNSRSLAAVCTGHAVGVDRGV